MLYVAFIIFILHHLVNNELKKNHILIFIHPIKKAVFIK